MNEREKERRERYIARMRKAFEQLLEREGIKLVEERGYITKLEYQGVTFLLLSNEDWNSWTKHYQVKVEGNTLATRCRLEVAIAKAKAYIEGER